MPHIPGEPLRLRSRNKLLNHGERRLAGVGPVQSTALTKTIPKGRLQGGARSGAMPRRPISLQDAKARLGEEESFGS